MGVIIEDNLLVAVVIPLLPPQPVLLAREADMLISIWRLSSELKYRSIDVRSLMKETLMLTMLSILLR